MRDCGLYFRRRVCIAARLAASSACALAHLRFVNSRQAYSIKLAIRTTLRTLAIPSFFCCPSSASLALGTFPPGGRLCKRRRRKITSGLAQSVTRRAMPAPGGKAAKKAKKKITSGLAQSVTKWAMPAPRGSLRKRLTIFAEKMKFTEFFSGKGKA